MTDKRDDGGPAFPASLCDDGFDSVSAGYGGMSVRDYFIAHAPAEPQPWFSPVMTTKKPLLPPRNELTTEQLRQLDADMADCDPDNCDPAVLDFARRLSEARAAREDWGNECNKQRYIQWPAAWADEMLKQRNR
jgi:hypothetical protein